MAFTELTFDSALKDRIASEKAGDIRPIFVLEDGTAISPSAFEKMVSASAALQGKFDFYHGAHLPSSQRKQELTRNPNNDFQIVHQKYLLKIDDQVKLIISDVQCKIPPVVFLLAIFHLAVALPP